MEHFFFFADINAVKELQEVAHLKIIIKKIHEMGSSISARDKRVKNMSEIDTSHITNSTIKL